MKNNSILITGGTGSLGKSLLNLLVNNKNYNPKSIRVLSRDEDKQYWLNHLYKDKVEFMIGDIRSQSTVVSALKDIDIVIHAAAMKQVPICEKFPYEAVQTNIMGANNIVNAIDQFKIPVKKVLGISTDKACDPINVYGMTKFIQEKIFSLANEKIKSTDFILARYGNVLGSRGSVIPLFQEQIKNGGPLTITDEKMTRFFFSLEDAVGTILAALAKGKKGEIFIPKIKSFSIMNLAKSMKKDSSIKIEVTGIRQGEKLHETLISKNEISKTYKINFNSKNYYVINPNGKNQKLLNSYTSEDDVNSLEETYELLKVNKFI